VKLTLVSPHTKGPHVLALQRQLKKHGYLQGKLEGEFGPDTARAVHRAKYWLGYRKPDQVAGDLLYALLKGAKKPTPVMKARIKARTPKPSKKPQRVKMWEEAGKYIGQTEHPPYSNRSMFNAWYGIVGAWCAMFVSYVAVKVGSKVFRKGKFYAYVPYILADARAGRNNLAITYFPQTGDLPLFDWDNDGVPDHIGFFGYWIDDAKHKFAGREGNTGPHDKSNGGQMMNTVRSKSDVIAFVHVGG
jgi:peptidoglycan hydrolase-like protein with peptidoglycan-binding domain